MSATITPIIAPAINQNAGAIMLTPAMGSMAADIIVLHNDDYAGALAWAENLGNQGAVLDRYNSLKGSRGWVEPLTIGAPIKALAGLIRVWRDLH